jgi:poly(A) polymerase
VKVGIDWSRLPGLRLADDLAAGYAAHGHEIALVGGAVRDFLTGREANDLDLVSDATPEQSRDLLRRWAGAADDVPNPFGVVECTKHGRLVQVASYRDHGTRSGSGPRGARLRRHLASFDLTINTIAIRLPGPRVEDPYGGIGDLRNRVLRTPVDPRITVRDWPPHILRVARFVAELGFAVSVDLVAAMRVGAPGLADADPAEYATSLDRMLAGPYAALALSLLDEVAAISRLSGPWRKRLVLAR